jgi:hypothetical protein
MEAKQIHAGDDIMANPSRQRSFETSIQARAAALGAGLLILLGTVFQLGELAYSRYCAGNAWFIATIAGNLWNGLAALVKAAGGPEVLRFLPLLLVAAGLALLLSAMGYGASAALRSSRGETERE